MTSGTTTTASGNWRPSALHTFENQSGVYA
jgi:hypothetical protein